MGEGYEPILNDNDNEDVNNAPEVEANGAGDNAKPFDNGSGPCEEDHSRGENGTSNDFGLQMEELEEDGRFKVFSKVTLSWRDVTVSVEQNTNSSPFPCCCNKTPPTPPKVILNEVSGLVEPGELVAIMGASGAGKTTLLNTLAFRNNSKLTTSGEIRVNGRSVSQSKIRKISAYVQQDDNFIATLTVKEVMMFHANLRMDPGISGEKRLKKVEEILSILSLTKVQDTLVGNPTGRFRGISGGERKRLSVGTELIMDPPLLFIDEPTSGLDSFMAENVVTLINQLAKANRTILCTIHQPTSEVFDLFDKVCLVSEGKIACMGDKSAILDIFSAAGYPCKVNFNPADHFIFTLAIRPGYEETCRARCQVIMEQFTNSQPHKDMLERIDSTRDSEPGVDVKGLRKREIQSSVMMQVKENLKRSLKTIVRSPAHSKARIMQSIVIGILMGITFLNTKNDQKVVQNKPGAIFNLIVYFTFSSIMVQTNSIPDELSVVRREYQNGMYTTLPYFLSKVVSEIPYLLGLPLLTMAVCYFLMSFTTDVVAFLTCVIAFAGVSWVGNGLGWFLACLTGDSTIASALVAPLIMPFFLVGGFYQNQESTPVFFEPVKYISWFRYGFSMLMTNEFSRVSHISCDDGVEVCDFSNGTQILERFSLDPVDSWWPNFPALLLIGGVLCLISWLCLLRRVRLT